MSDLHELAKEITAKGGKLEQRADGTPVITIPVGPGHNSRSSRAASSEVETRPSRDAATDDRLRLLVERVERLEEEKKGIADDIRDVFGEAKAVGYDVKIMRQVLRLRKMDPNARSEMETLLEVYKAAMGLG